MKRNLLIVTPIFPRWVGDSVASHTVHDLAVSLVRYYNVYLLCPHYFCAADREEIEGVQIVRYRYFVPDKWQLLSSAEGLLENIKLGFFAMLQVPFFVAAQAYYLIRIMRKNEIDIVNTHWIFPQGLIYSLIRLFLKKPHIMTIHDTGVFSVSKFGFLGKMVMRFILKKTDIVLPVNTHIRYLLEKVAKTVFNHKIIHMGTDPDRYFYVGEKNALRKKIGVTKGAKIVLFVGKLQEKSGAHYLLQMAEILNRNHSDFVVLILGTGAMEKSMKEWVVSKKLSDKIKFMGYVDSKAIPEYYSISDIVVIPSVFDTDGIVDIPSVLLEAMSAGTPVAVSRISGVTDILKDGVNGWLFEPGNYYDMAKKVENMYNPKETEKVTAEALKTARTYSWENVCEQYHAVISDVLAKYNPKF